METISRHVADLDQTDRSALERVVGHSLHEMQQVIIQVSNNPPDQKANGQTPAGQLPAWCNVYEGLADAEIDELDRSIIRHPGGRES
jgi:hypothetical protein